MSLLSRVHIAYKALRELESHILTQYALYRIGLRSGYYRFVLPKNYHLPQASPSLLTPKSLIPLPNASELAEVLGDEGVAALLSEADEISRGQIRLFGGPPVSLQLDPPKPLRHWTSYELNSRYYPQKDIRWLWEPARFGWAYTFGRAYRLSSEDRYAQAFWDYFEHFQAANPPFLGIHWTSAQEAALRLIALVFAAHVFARSSHSTQERQTKLGHAIAIHAARIPPTLIYARAQNNNHLLVEAAGLLTAGLTLPYHPQAQYWRRLGERWFYHAIKYQIDENGVYIQHSTNYHRLMLQVALWIYLLIQQNQTGITNGIDLKPFPPMLMRRLSSATKWLNAMTDGQTGRAPNLGPNDGAYIMPLSTCPHGDYRPVVQAAAIAFLGRRTYAPGLWDEMALWFGSRTTDLKPKTTTSRPSSPSKSFADHNVEAHILRAPHSWAYLRVARFTSRPGHADQLHLDLWWRGFNIAQDAGTYLYNAAPPWNNSLARTDAHNTIMVNHQDQMTYGGRFLWVDWAQGKVFIEHTIPDDGHTHLIAQHDGYRRLGVIHQRSVEHDGDMWTVTDTLLPSHSGALRGRTQKDQQRNYDIRLHWLLPDWRWEMEYKPNCCVSFQLLSPEGWIKLEVSAVLQKLKSIQNKGNEVQVVRAGELLSGSGSASPTWGWVSPTYGYKEPALSLGLKYNSPLPAIITSKWLFP